MAQGTGERQSKAGWSGADFLVFFFCLPELRAEDASPSAPSTCISESGIKCSEEVEERLRQEMGQRTRAPVLPQPPSYLAWDGERVLTHKHNVPRDLEMGDLGRENQLLCNLPATAEPAQLVSPKPGSPVALNPRAFTCQSPADAGCTGLAGN